MTFSQHIDYANNDYGRIVSACSAGSLHSSLPIRHGATKAFTHLPARQCPISPMACYYATGLGGAHSDSRPMQVLNTTSFIIRSVNMVLAESVTVCPLLVGGGRSLIPPTLVDGS